MRIAAYFCASLSQIWIPEIEYYQKVSSHAQIGALGAKKGHKMVNSAHIYLSQLVTLQDSRKYSCYKPETNVFH